jgi:RNA polymerase sigma factor (sigma-70 family)
MAGSLIWMGDKRVKVCMMAYVTSFARHSAFARRARGAIPPIILMQPAEQFNRLLRQVAEGQDRAAFQGLFEHFAPRIKAYLVRLGAAPGIAEDLAQEAMLVLWRKAALFDPTKASAATWVFTIARNLRIDALRRERRSRIDPDELSFAPEMEWGADEQLVVRQSEEALRAALRVLPPDQSEIVMLSFFSDKPHSQIAAELNIPLGTVKSRLRLAMVRLRAALGDEP